MDSSGVDLAVTTPQPLEEHKYLDAISLSEEDKTFYNMEVKRAEKKAKERKRNELRNKWVDSVSDPRCNVRT